MIVDHQLLQKIWKALQAPTRTGTPTIGRNLLRQIAEDGWMYGYQLEDIAYAFDPRVISFDCGFDLKTLSETMGYRWQSFYPRPRMRSIEAVGGDGLRAADAAGFLLQLEALGFAFDASVLVDALRPAIAKKRFVDAAELDIFWAPKVRGKSSLTLEVAERTRGYSEIKSGKLANGHRYEIWLGDDGSVCTLSVKSPKFREVRRPVETICGACGYRWWRGDPDSSASHRKEHKLRMIALDPQPNEQLLEARSFDGDPELVVAGSPGWKHAEIYRRAVAFKREMGFDFVQWDGPDGDRDPHVQGFLLGDDAGRILGAIAFRRREVEDRSEPAFWGLQWVWVCPAARRAGVLSRRWAYFRERFGDFYVEGPVSKEMQAFLRHRGEEHLMEWPSRRSETSKIDA